MGKTLSDVAADDAGRNQVLDDLGQGLASFVVTLSPTRIVIGGGVAKSPDFHADVAAGMRRWLGGYVASDVLDGTGYVVQPALGDRAGVAGGIALAQDLLERHTLARR